MSDTTPLRIAVVGAGPAGLTFASILHRKAREFQQRDARHTVVPYDVTLFEAEPSADARRVGGSLDLGRHTGLRALEAAGLFNRFHDFARPEGQEIRLVNHKGEMIFHFAGDATPDDDRYSPEIDRADLNRVLVESLPCDAIQWGHKLQHVRACPENQYELVFANGATFLADVVVGADGAWSRVRKLVTDQTPVYPDADATFLDITVHAFNERFPELASLIGKGTLYSFGGGNMLVAQRNRRDVVHVYLGIRAPPDWRQHALLKDVTSTDRERVVTLVKACFGEWGEQLCALAMAAAESVGDAEDTKGAGLLSWPLYAMPVGVRWTPSTGVTLIGDAAHLMSPCAGEGVNTAMVDAMELALALARPMEEKETGDTNAYREAALTAITAYEREMFQRVEDPARRSSENLALFFTVPEMTAEHAAQMFGKEVSSTNPLPPGSA